MVIDSRVMKDDQFRITESTSRISIGASHNEKKRRKSNVEYSDIAESRTREDLGVTYVPMECNSRSGCMELASIHTMKRNALLLRRLFVI